MATKKLRLEYRHSIIRFSWGCRALSVLNADQAKWAIVAVWECDFPSLIDTVSGGSGDMVSFFTLADFSNISRRRKSVFSDFRWSSKELATEMTEMALLQSFILYKTNDLYLSVYSLQRIERYSNILLFSWIFVFFISWYRRTRTSNELEKSTTRLTSNIPSSFSWNDWTIKMPMQHNSSSIIKKQNEKNIEA